MRQWARGHWTVELLVGGGEAAEGGRKKYFLIHNFCLGWMGWRGMVLDKKNIYIFCINCNFIVHDHALVSSLILTVLRFHIV
jgi:hypothetical protein